MENLPFGKPLEQRAAEHTADGKYRCHCCGAESVGIPTIAYSAGWTDRDAHLHACLFSKAAPSDPIEMAIQAYGKGYEEGAGDNDQIIDRFESFARRVHGLVGGETFLGKEAAELLKALEASKRT